ncbi:MAG: TIGR03960 family B12-binding radical SAM protein [Thermodesulfovibrionales bacterium]|nr:TIGR03960 family B12-binding radical SAM protein [Thermodesulfovibrionales bacterium]
MNFSIFQTPSRYINSEINSIHKRGDQQVIVKYALVFPDVYEIGMSHLGLKILYEIINSLPYASAERAFSPWIDFEEYIRRNNIPLTSLESKIPLKDFDVVGFSLQHELSYTTVLNILDLGGIPLFTEERLTDKSKLPLIIAGGPCAVNPHPLSPFIDAFLIGDGEEAIVELSEVIKRWKLQGDNKKSTLLKEIIAIEGFYVPLLHNKRDKIKRRFIKDLDEAPHPVQPIVPYTQIVHDRIAIEVSRGCTMGCRFCQAGLIYRPLRIRSPKNVLNIAERSLLNTGYEEVSFLSLSAGDYPYLLEVMREFNRRFSQSKISLSLPSLKVGSVNKDILREIRFIKKTGFTIAPEAATERLRRVINKDFTEDDYERALTDLFSEGWLNLKLYFMIGLPTETEEDIEEIPKMVLKALRISKKNTNRFVNISVTISPFVPKPHTPFQWIGQSSIEEIIRKLSFLKDEISRRRLKFKGHNEKMSFLEAVFARGDATLSPLLFVAWQRGCRLDAWSETFDFDKWRDAMDKTGIDPKIFSERHYSLDSELPWENIESGIKKDFLINEYRKALASEKSDNCIKICHFCGLECRKLSCFEKVKRTPFQMTPLSDDKYSTKFNHRNSLKLRIQYSKGMVLRFLSHHELIKVLLRAIRKANVPVLFSSGFHPTPLVSFCPPLNVGVAGEREYFDVEVPSSFDVISNIEKLKNTLPEGIGIKKWAIIPKDEPSLVNFIRRYEYMIDVVNSGIEIPKLNINSLIVKRDKREIDLRELIENIIYLHTEGVIRLILLDKDTLKVRLNEIVYALFGVSIKDLSITRTNLYGWKNGWVEPL